MAVLELKNVKMQYKDGSQQIDALKETNFSVEKGEFVAIVGPSGSGKSTFLTISGGLQTPTEGSVFINDKNYTTLSEKERSKMRFESIGFVLQASNLIPFLSVKEQLILVDKLNHDKNEEKQKQLLEELGISHLEKKYPSDLSGGERQRVAIARALYNNPSVILADEPTASLDSDRAYEIVNLLAKESKVHQKAVIMVTHDLRMIEKCDKIYRMKDGVLTLENKK